MVDRSKFQEAMSESDRALDWMFQKVQEQNESGTKVLEERSKKSETAAKEDLRSRILNADLSSIRAQRVVEEENFGKAMMGLQLKMNEMGEKFKEVQEPSAEEKGRIEEQVSLIARLETELKELDNAWWMKNSRKAGVQLKLDQARMDKSKLETSVKESINERIRRAKISDNLQTFLSWARKVSQIMSARVNDIAKEIFSCMTMRDELYVTKAEYSKIYENAQVVLEILQADLKRAEEDLGPLENGKPEFVDQEKKISLLKDNIRSKESERNESLVRFQENEKGIKRLEEHVQAQTGLKDNHKMWLAVLEEATKVHMVAFQSRLQAIKAAADQEVANNHDQVGARVAEEEMVELAAIMKASDDILMNKIERSPEEIRRMHEILAAAAEAKARLRERLGVQLQEVNDKYGIDLLSASEATYLAKGGIAPGI